MGFDRINFGMSPKLVNVLVGDDEKVHIGATDREHAVFELKSPLDSFGSNAEKAYLFVSLGYYWICSLAESESQQQCRLPKTAVSYKRGFDRFLLRSE